MSTPSVIEIVKEYLKAHGYDGLVEEGGECGCDLPNLVPCDDIYGDCQAGIKTKCGEECVLDGDCNFHITPEKPGTALPPTPKQLPSGEKD